MQPAAQQYITNQTQFPTCSERFVPPAKKTDWIDRLRRRLTGPPEWKRWSSVLLFVSLTITLVSFNIFALLFSLPPSRISDPASQAGSASPFPLGHAPSFLSRERVQHFLPSSTRVELCLPVWFDLLVLSQLVGFTAPPNQ